MKVRYWTPLEDKIIRDNWITMTDRELSALLPGRTMHAINQHRAVDLCLTYKELYQKAKASPSVPGGYRGAMPDNWTDAKLVKHIDLLRRVYGTYGGVR